MKKDWIVGLTTLALLTALVIAVVNKPQQVVVAPHSHELMSEHEHEAAHAASHHGQPRSPEWPKVRAAYLKDHPTCAACGTDVGLQIHHVKDFHEHPELELDPTNFITLCGPEKHNCHLRIGHRFNFVLCANPHVREDAAAQLKRIKEREEDCK